MIVNVSEWKETCIQYMLSCGMPEKDAETVVEAALLGDLRGVKSHGTSRLPIYRNRIKVGVVNSRPIPRILNDAPAFLSIDGDNGLGQIATKYALDECISRASSFGISCAAVKHSNHIGMLAYYAVKASEQGMISFITCHTQAFAAAPGGKQPVVGTNPHCWGFPFQRGPIVLDMAITVARGKIKDAFEQGKDIPLGWAVDRYGKDTTNAKEALDGLLLPVGGAKGYGLGIVSSMLSGVVGGTPFRSDIIHSLDNLTVPANSGAFLMVMDPSKVIGKEEYEERTQQLYDFVKNSEKWDPSGEVYMPGEIEQRKFERCMETGVEIDEKTYNYVTGREEFVPTFKSK